MIYVYRTLVEHSLNKETNQMHKTKYDYHNRELHINDVVHLDYKPRGQDRARIVAFTNQKVKVYDMVNDKTLYIKPHNLTKIFE